MSGGDTTAAELADLMRQLGPVERFIMIQAIHRCASGEQTAEEAGEQAKAEVQAYRAQVAA